jgi:hypothetical protein
VKGGHYFVVLLLEFAAFTRGRNSECGGVERVVGEVFTVFVECRDGGGTRNSAQTKCHNEGIYFEKLIMSHLDQALNLQYTVFYLNIVIDECVSTSRIRKRR